MESLKERGIDACLEVRDVNQTPSIESTEQLDQYSDQKIYARLPQQLNDFENMLAEMRDAELEELVQEQK